MSLTDTLLELAPAVVHEIEILVRLIAMSDSPEDAVRKAQRVLIADAADAATDAGLAKLLGR